MGFNRLSRFLEAAGRRLLHLLWTMCYDDGTLQDLSSAESQGQTAILVFFEYCGFTLASAKRQVMAAAPDFLGLSHNVSRALSHDEVSFWPKQHLCAKLTTMLTERLDQRTTTPAQASKIVGVQGFLALGMYGQVGRGGIRPLRQRQQEC